MKKLNTKGFAHIELFIALVVIVIVGGIGFYVFNSVQNRSSSAETIRQQPEAQAI